MEIRKIYTIVEETRNAYGKELEEPLKKATTVAVIKNPYTNVYQEDLSAFYDIGEELGELLIHEALKALGVNEDDAHERIDSYGKAVIVGLDGDLEQGHAIIHPKFGLLRQFIGGKENAKAVMPCTAKMGIPGTTIDVPLFYKNSEWVVTHADSMEVTVPGSPVKDEIVVALAVATGGRPFSRVSGPRKEEFAGVR
ncbi:amino acid synthesis family protein [Sporosarcina sp. CAU 1771]